MVSDSPEKPRAKTITKTITKGSSKAISASSNAISKRSLTKPGPHQTPQITLPQLHDEYLRARRAEGIRESTLAMYKDALRLWGKWCAGQGIETVSQIQTKHVQDYLLSLMARRLSERTVRNRAIVLKGTLKHAFRQEYLASERLYDWKLPKMARAQVYMPDHSEVGLILDAIRQHWSVAQNPRSRFRNAAARIFFGRRDQAIVAVQVSTGLRISETLGLRLEDYSKEHACLTVTHSKSGRPRTVPVSAALAPLLDDWLRVRPKASPTNFLFVSEFGGQLHRDPFSHQFQRYLEFARSQGHDLPRITLHSLRHLAGTAMAEHDLYHASLILGHSSVKITADNYLHARAGQIRATHEAADPLAQILLRGRTKAGKRNKLV